MFNLFRRIEITIAEPVTLDDCRIKNEVYYVTEPTLVGFYKAINNTTLVERNFIMQYIHYWQRKRGKKFTEITWR